MDKDVYRFLTRPKKTKAQIACIDERIDDLRDMLKPSGIRYDRDKVQSSQQDPMPRFAAQIMELTETRRELMQQYAAEQDEVSGAIDTIDDIYVRQVMTMRYVSCKSWLMITERMPFSESQIYRFHRRGLAHIKNAVLKHDSE